MPWHKRIEKAQQERLEAESRYASALGDWYLILKNKRAIDKEIELNDWTRTAALLFATAKQEGEE